MKNSLSSKDDVEIEDTESENVGDRGDRILLSTSTFIWEIPILEFITPGPPVVDGLVVSI